jgi:assimilatory nitrate reductase catalytic subunit
VHHDPIDMPPLAYWTRARVTGGWLTELAGMGEIDMDALLPAGTRIEAVDYRRGMQRVAVLDGEGALTAALFATRSGQLPSRAWIAQQLGQNEASATELLAGRAVAGGPDRGPIVCACFDVGMNTILGAIAAQELISVEAVGAALNAGTNCGSCRPAIARLIGDSQAGISEAAE